MTTPDSSPTPALLDYAAVNELQEMLGQQDFADLVQTLLSNMPVQLAALETALERGDAELLFRAAHKLKSGSGSIGAPQLAELARHLEKLGRSGDLTGAAPLLEQIQAVAEQTQAAFRALLNG